MNVQTMCRVCIGRDSGMVSIFESYSFSAHNFEIFKVITDCASVQIQKFDGFSEQICRRCLDHLSQAYSFKKLCEDSDYKFRNGLIISDEVVIKSEFSAEDSIIYYDGGGGDDIQEKTSNATDFQDSRTVKTEQCNGENTITYSDKHQYGKEEVSSSLLEIVKCDEPSVLNESQCTENKRGSTYKCELCSKAFGTKRSLVRHMEVHTGHRPHLCNICGKTFQQNTHLKQHMRLHTGEKPYKCEVCAKQFSQKCNFTAHYRCHTNTPGYKCDFCGKQYRRNGDLVVHVRSHTGEKPYKCEFCEKTFTDSSSLVKHHRSHTGEKPYKCGFCEKTFSLSCNLMRHIRRHAGEKAFV